MTPICYGDLIAEFDPQLVALVISALEGKEIEIDGRDNAIREEVRRIDAECEFCVQLCRSLEEQPVEDTTAVWDGQKYPFQKVAMIRAPARDSCDAALVKEVNEKMQFSVWTRLFSV